MNDKQTKPFASLNTTSMNCKGVFRPVRSVVTEDGAIFKQVVRKNPYMKSITDRKAPACQTKGTNAEIY